MQELEIKMVNDLNEVKRLVNEEGFTPVECSSGKESVVDDLDMDHHGEKSDNESVAIRAYRDHFGARKDNPKFVVMGTLDADASFAVLALAGKLPHPDSEYAASLPPHLQKTWQQDLTPLAQTIATIDTDPIGRDVLNMPQGDMLITWNALYGGGRNNMEALAGAQGWLTLTTKPAAKTFINAGKASEQQRRDAALQDLSERGQKVGKVMTLENSRVFGFSEWYGRNPEKGKPDEVSGWDNPVVIALTDRGNISFGSPNKEVAEKVLGKGGLMNVFERLNKEFGLEEGKGFGGREAVGGSPRGKTYTAEDLHKVAVVTNQVCTGKMANLMKEGQRSK